MDIKTLIAVATGEINHIYNGLCPDFQTSPNSRDDECPACKILTDAAAEHDDLEHRLQVAEPRIAEQAQAQALIEAWRAADYELLNALKKRCYIFSESHLSGYRLIIGFNTLDDVQGAHQQIVKSRAVRPREVQPARGEG